MFGPWACLLVDPGPPLGGPFGQSSSILRGVSSLHMRHDSYITLVCVHTSEGHSVAVGAEVASVTCSLWPGLITGRRAWPWGRSQPQNDPGVGRGLACSYPNYLFVACGMVARFPLTGTSVTRFFYGFPFGFSQGLVFDIWY